MTALGRRTVTTTLGIGAVSLVAGCGEETGAADPGGGATSSATPSPSRADAVTSSTATASSVPPTTPATPPDGGGAEPLVAVVDVPVGGGVVLEAERLVVTRPRAGDVRCFTAVCTHTGCLVTAVSDGVIACPCHGSTFSAEDGSVLGGPASGPLAERPVRVRDGAVVAG